MLTIFTEPKNTNEARLQANITARAATLFTDGYDWYIADTNPYLFGICSPEGRQYGVDMEKNTCTCIAFTNYGDCKHRIAIANTMDCFDASLCKRYELETA